MQASTGLLPSLGGEFLMKLSEKIKYQKGAIVSQEIARKETGTVTVFAFDKGQGLSEHTAPFDAIIYILDGEAMVTVEGKPSKVKAGELFIMPANKPHSVSAEVPFKMMLIMIRSSGKL
ncbi:MAG: cupin domain-containing protein [Candidatus Omnitrophica bacterium]|nr:cupin domain-containing protein [Candidatus Omnitrophota bacterium]